MALRWKKDPSETGLRRIGAGPRGSKLHDGKTQYASIRPHSTRHTGKSGWYWVAGWGGSVPHYNSCNDAPLSEDEAKAAAMAYVKQHMAKEPSP